MKLPWFSKHKITKEEELIFWSARTLPEDMAEATDFDAEEAIDLDYSIQLPESYSLGKWIYKTSNQWTLWACTSLWTTHWVQILNVKKKWVIPTTRNIITPIWKDLWGKMWHSTTEYDGWDYVEKAVSTALKQGILIQENWQLARFDAYATDSWDSNDASIEKMKRYLYKGCPIIWCVRWNKKMWNEMTAWEIKTVPTNVTGWHCIALVGWDKWWLRFVNSWAPNDEKKLKSRFYVKYEMMKKLGIKFNFRYRVLYMKEDEAKSAEYLKRKNAYVEVLRTLKKYYPEESVEIKKGIESLSLVLRRNYPEINNDLPK